jgi:serine protease Do
MPDYNDDKEGVLLRGVAEGMPAAKAGLKEGDRLVQINGQPVKSLTGYMQIMSTKKQGESLDLGIIRDGKSMKLKLKLE